MFISDLAYMVMKPLAKGVTTIAKNTSEVVSDSDVGKYLLGGIVVICYAAYKITDRICRSTNKEDK